MTAESDSHADQSPSEPQPAPPAEAIASSDQVTLRLSRRVEPPLQFSLETMLLLTTLVAVCLGISVAVPEVGIPVSIVALGGLIRTLVIARHRRRLRMPFLLVDKIVEFIVSSGVVFAALGVGAVTILLICGMGGLLVTAVDAWTGGRPVGPTAGSVLAVLVILFMALAVFAPIITTVWFLWATRPR